MAGISIISVTEKYLQLLNETSSRDCARFMNSGHSYSQKSWKIEAFSLCVILSKAPSGPPWNEGHRPKVRHETSVLEVPVQEQL